MYELFGINYVNKIEFLGYFKYKEQLFRALDEFMGLGYKKINYCKWKVR